MRERRKKAGRMQAARVRLMAEQSKAGQGTTGRNAGQSVINRSYATPLPADFLIYDSFN